jgi:hypothetical protein
VRAGSAPKVRRWGCSKLETRYLKLLRIVVDDKEAARLLADRVVQLS